MPAPTLGISPSADGRSATLTFTAEDAGVVMAVSALELDTMIAGLAAARAHLSPPVPATHTNVPIDNPVPIRAAVPAERIGGRRLVLFRHPGHGWLAFSLRPGEGEDLIAGISAALHADRAAGLT